MNESLDSFCDIPWIRDTLHVCSILERIAKKFPPDSPESLAIAEAALALQFLRSHRALAESYQKLKSRMGGEIDHETRRRIESHGIDLTSLDSNES